MEVFEVAGVLAQARHAMCTYKDMRQLALITIVIMLQAYRGKRATSMRAAEKSSTRWCHHWRYLACECTLISTLQSNHENWYLSGLHTPSMQI